MNFCSELYKKELKMCYIMLDLKNLTDTMKFWKFVKPFLFDKNAILPNISFSEKGKILSVESKVFFLFNKFFENAM